VVKGGSLTHADQAVARLADWARRRALIDYRQMQFS
jgi:hypothetical protein